jgi:phosphate-selective porin OprO/OprP
MKKFNLLLTGMIVSVTMFAQEPFNVKWDNGFKFESSDKSFKLKFGGRINMDWAFFSQDDTLTSLFGDPNNTTEFRRIRFYNSGQVYKTVAYKLQFDFGKGKATLKDAFIELKKLPFVGNLRVGHFKEPIRMEVETSGKYLLFMERANNASFLPERNFGFMLHNAILNQRMTYSLATFRRADAFGNDTGKDDYSATGRLTGLVFNNKEKAHLLHLGAAYSYRNPSADSYKVSSSPESHMAPKYVSTGTIANVTNVGVAAGELAVVWGSFSLQGEYLASMVNTSDSISSYGFSSYYGAVSFFVTGEHRNYLTKSAAFGRVKPKKNYDGDGGFGALELVARYSEINLDSKNVNGGIMRDVTFGANWYLNPVTRVMFNYIISDLSGVSATGKANIAQVRFQVDF